MSFFHTIFFFWFLIGCTVCLFISFLFLQVKDFIKLVKETDLKIKLKEEREENFKTLHKLLDELGVETMPRNKEDAVILRNKWEQVSILMKKIR